MGYPAEENGPVNLIFSVLIFLPSLAVGARRLHDIGRSGWWQLIALTVIGNIINSLVCNNWVFKKKRAWAPIKLKK